ncbi:MAG: hypothetical protein ACHQKY_11455, partial [Terriglobia bacterium]
MADPSRSLSQLFRKRPPAQKTNTEDLDSDRVRALLDALSSAVAKEEHLDAVASFCARILPVYLTERLANKYFQFWEAHGFHITPVHFHQPIPDTRTLSDDLWTRESGLAGVDMNETGQLRYLHEIFPSFKSEYDLIPTTPTDCAHEFYLQNGAFGETDAYVLYCMVRHFKPSLILEVGSGFSSRLLAQTALRNGNTELICIDPHPGAVVANGFPGLTSLIPKKVQEVGMGLFGRLGARDI